MTVVRPFRAVRYDAARTNLSKVIVPPYDVIAADERGDFFDRDPHNAIRFELTRDARDEASTDYGWIRDTLDDWRARGVLIQDPEPGYYVMRQRYVAPSGEKLERTGFFAELGLAEYDERVVRPHERTLAGPKADRLKLLRAAEANLSSVFLLYEDQDDVLGPLLGRAFDGGQVGEAVDSAGVEYALARLTDPEAIRQVEDFLAVRPTVIADGHHRYETALNYRRECRERQGDSDRRGAGARGARAEGAPAPAAPEAAAPWESTIAYFANAYAKGSLLLPIHRVLADGAAPSEAEWRERLPGWTVRALASAGPGEIEARLAAELAPCASRPAFAAESRDGTLLLITRDEPLGDRLMVRLLESEILGGVFGLDGDAIRGGAIRFPKSAKRASQELREGLGQVALYLNPMHPDDVFRTTGEGEVMPQKSTFFFPKIPTGMVFRDHRNPPGASGR